MDLTAGRTAQLSDHQLQVDVLNALDHDPLSRTAIGVTVSHGIVTLLGVVPSWREAIIAEQAVYSTPGVLGIANELQIQERRADNDSVIAEAAVEALAWYRSVADATVQVIVSDGYVTLCGVVADVQLRAAMERAVRGIRGVRGVWNALNVVRATQHVPAPARREMCTM
jgi:osmotically-inducible protein OsmY